MANDDKNKKCRITSFWDEYNKRSSLQGLTSEEKMTFAAIVQKQLDKDIEVKIRYKYLDSPE